MNIRGYELNIQQKVNHPPLYYWTKDGKASGLSLGYIYYLRDEFIYYFDSEAEAKAALMEALDLSPGDVARDKFANKLENLL